MSLSLSLSMLAKASTSRGVFTAKCEINFSKAVGAALEITGSSSGNQIVSPDFNFEELGIGGLDTQFQAIFRRAFASRIFPPQLVNKLGIKHVRGILLFGPPGTGKTLMARQIGKMLRAKEPKIVNGPEILNKFVGQSEENIRNLFKDAEEEYKKRGDSSDLHIIIFDELDAICKQRGSKNDGTGVGDSVVNQLLAKMDGVEQLNNILVIGMTNRKDMIDEALLRPGRLEVQIEVNLPDRDGRLQIFTIHTTPMRTNKLMASDVTLDYLADNSKNFSGAEIAGVVRSATSFAFNRHIEGGTMAKVADTANKLLVNMADFKNALDEVIPAFGVTTADFEGTMLNGIIDYGPSVERTLSSGDLFVRQVTNSVRTPLISLLLHGPAGAGTTSLAVKIAMNSNFPYIKLISPENMVGMSESSKASAIAKVFENAYKSPLAVIVVDSIEKLLEYVPIGPRFSNVVLQALIILLKRVPPPVRGNRICPSIFFFFFYMVLTGSPLSLSLQGHRLFVICTSSRRNILDEMGMSDCFSGELYFSNIQTVEEISSVLKQLKIFEGERLTKVLGLLRAMQADEKLSIGIKKLLLLVEMARQDEGREIEKFIEAMQDHIGRIPSAL